LSVLVVSFFSLFIASAHANAQQAGRPETAFVNVNVVPMDSERVLRGQTVIVVGDRIMQVGPTADVAIPAGANRVDGAGKYLMPGLSEMHGHTPGGNATDEFRRQVMFLYAANGVTTVRGMLGIPGDLDLKAKTNSGEMWGPTLYLAGPSFNGNTVTSPEQAAARVWEQKNGGWDHLKIHPGLTVPQYDALARAAGQAGIRFGGHVPADVGIVHAIRMGQETFDHLDGYLEYAGGVQGSFDRAKAEELIELTIGAGAWVVPTMVLWEVGVIGLGDVDELSARPEMAYWPRQGVEGWANRLRAVQAQSGWNRETAMAHATNRTRLLEMMNDAGVGILMGTDSPQMFSVPGFSLHREMQAMADAGMSPFEILVSGTRNVGTYFQAYDSFGTVAAGRRADLILTNSNPLDSIENVADRAGVMIRGVWKSEAEIQRELGAIATSFGNP
jgi:imidazolonepropionase-like amidohydrolase